MSTTSSATTTLYVNGKPAEDEIRRLRGELDQYKLCTPACVLV